MATRCRAEAGQQLVVDGDRVLAAVERAEPEPLVDERLGDLFAQRQLGRRAEAGQQIVVDGDRVLAAVERAERDPLVDKCCGLPVSMVGVD